MRWTARARRTTGTGAALAVACVVTAGVLAAPPGAAVFSNPAQVAVPGTGSQGVANPYPSAIEVAGLTGAVTNVTATVTGLRHTYPGDVDLLLVGPSGQTVVLLADVGGGTDVTGIDLTFSSATATPVPSPIVSGTFRPTANGPFNGPAPAPPGPYGASLAVFNGTVPNGTWRLFAFDDVAGDVGAITGGWSLDITTNGPTIASFAPPTGPAGTTVVVTGTNLTGATSVTFGGIPAAAFTVTNPTTITATVPAGALSGPIAVTTPNGTATSTTSYEISPPPTVTALSPSTGPVGTEVVVTGTNLAGLTGVSFAGTPATQFALTSPTTATATVPNGAGGGPVTVATPAGTAASPTAFTVTHARNVSLTVNRRRSRGTVNVTDGFAKCAQNATVTLQRRNRRGIWRRRGRDVTNAAGAYAIPGRRGPGRYRAVVAPLTLPSSDSCLQAVSDTVRRG